MVILLSMSTEPTIAESSANLKKSYVYYSPICDRILVNTQ